MVSLYDYDFLQNSVFYRSEHILKYLERHKDISELDKEAIANTILDALVTEGLIDPEKQSLDFESLCIVDDLDHIIYNSTPNVTSIPLSIKKLMRQKCIIISASIPISIFCAKPAGLVQTCIYDMNTAFSSLFPDFKFSLCNYDSPTKKGKKALKRPFVEVVINGEDYLVDMLTKRIYKTSWFKEEFYLDTIYEVSSQDFTEEQKAYYQKRTQEHQNMAAYLHMMELITNSGTLHQKMEETLYELEESKKYFPEAWDELTVMKEDMRKLGFMDYKNIV